jgi:hypothetical protein
VVILHPFKVSRLTSAATGEVGAPWFHGRSEGEPVLDLLGVACGGGRYLQADLRLSGGLFRFNMKPRSGRRAAGMADD